MSISACKPTCSFHTSIYSDRPRSCSSLEITKERSPPLLPAVFPLLLAHLLSIPSPLFRLRFLLLFLFLRSLKPLPELLFYLLPCLPEHFCPFSPLRLPYRPSQSTFLFQAHRLHPFLEFVSTPRTPKLHKPLLDRGGTLCARKSALSTGVAPSVGAWLYQSNFFFAVTWPIGLAEAAHRFSFC